MDGPYFHHRAFLATAHDAQEYAVSLVLSDPKSAVDQSEIGDRYAGAKALKNRIENMRPADGIFVLKHNGDFKTRSGKVDLQMLHKIVGKGYSNDIRPDTFPGENKVKQFFSSIFEDGRDAMMAFTSPV